MATSPTTPDPATAPPMSNEADIGSGEKTPGQLETEKMIGAVPTLPPDGDQHVKPNDQGAQADPDGQDPQAGKTAPSDRP